jgi:hypothetical protein
MQAISRHHVMSNVSKNIVKKALENLYNNVNNNDSTNINPLNNGRIAFSEAKNYKFSYQGFDIYTLSTDDVNVPVVWKKETVKNPDGTETDWLVAYTTDDDEIERTVLSSLQSSSNTNVIPNGARVVEMFTGRRGTAMSDARVGIDKRVAVLWDGAENSTFVDPSSLMLESRQQTTSNNKIASRNAALRAIAEPTLPKNQIPIAPGVFNKSLQVDQSGKGGKATVTVEFNDPDKGESFFKQIEDLTSEMGESKPEEQTGTETQQTPQQQQNQSQQLQNMQQVPATPPPPPPAPKAQPQASTIKTLTHYGSKVVTLIEEKFDKYASKFYFVNEEGLRVYLPISRVKVGSTIVRPDNGEKIRVISYQVVESSSDDDLILKKLGVDVSDKVPPMGWTNKESQDSDMGKPLPPNPALQENAAPSADTSDKEQPLYDSQKDSDSKPGFNLQVDPNENEVTVKFKKPPVVEEIEEAVKSEQPDLMQQQLQQQIQQQPAQRNKTNFNQTQSPVQF